MRLLRSRPSKRTQCFNQRVRVIASAVGGVPKTRIQSGMIHRCQMHEVQGKRVPLCIVHRKGVAFVLLRYRHQVNGCTQGRLAYSQRARPAGEVVSIRIRGRKTFDGSQRSGRGGPGQKGDSAIFCNSLVSADIADESGRGCGNRGDSNDSRSGVGNTCYTACNPLAR